MFSEAKIKKKENKEKILNRKRCKKFAEKCSKMKIKTVFDQKSWLR
jgi:hypothetical protein